MYIKICATPLGEREGIKFAQPVRMEILFCSLMEEQSLISSHIRYQINYTDIIEKEDVNTRFISPFSCHTFLCYLPRPLPFPLPLPRRNTDTGFGPT